MKKKLLLIVIIITTSVVMISCSKKTIGTGDKTMDSIVIDENTRKTTNSKNEIKTTLIAKTEKVDIRETGKSDVKETKKSNSTMRTINGKIVQYSYSEIADGDKIVQFPKLSLDGVKIGTITDEKNEEGLNKISWENKNITGRLLTPYMGLDEARMLKNNKVYKFDSNGELKEIKAYEKLIKEEGDNLNRFGIYGAIDVYEKMDEPGKLEKVSIIDTENDKYFEIYGDALGVIKENSFIPLAIEGNRLYVRITSTSADRSTPVGYFENNVYTEIFSPYKKGMNIQAQGDMIYSNERILFAGSVENKNGIWKYDIEKNKLSNVLDTDSGKWPGFNLNKQRDKVVITGSGYNNETNRNTFTLNIADIDENLDIANITNVVSVEEEDNLYSNFSGWSDDGTEFYINTLATNVDGVKYKAGDGYYEVYKIGN